ncbi:MAG: hypothetical protein DMF56_27740 [Acidobacteria bacterium]|nr:MAG: hypothetical protein DMF56_27740 [Acidobacteriota bacterium]
MEVSTLLASLAAIAISIYALTFQRRLGHEISTQTLIHAQYELCRALDVLRVEHPEVSHMLALPAQNGSDAWKYYRVFKAHVRQLIEAEDTNREAARSRLYLQEHATALHVCDIYEQTLYQRQHAEEAGDKKRFIVLDTLVRYYETRMLRSPRFRYHWDNGASEMMEPPTRARYDKMVREPYPNEAADPKSPLED